jgi:sugar phosphate isomerase/epimerase
MGARMIRRLFIVFLLVTISSTLLAQNKELIQNPGPDNFPPPTTHINYDALNKLGWKLSCQAYTFREMSFFETLDLLQAMDIHYVELYPGQKLSKEHPELKTDHNMSEEAFAQLQNKLAETHIKAVNYGVVDLPNDEAKARKVFDFAKKLGLETIVAEPPEDAFEMLDKLCNEYQINIAIHDHPKPSHYWNPDLVLKVSEGRSHRIGSCSDVGHWLTSGLVPLDCIKKLEGRIISLHVKDHDDKNLDVIWGTGRCDIKGIMTELKRQGFKGVFSAEYERSHGHELASNVAKSYDYFSEVATELAKDLTAAPSASRNDSGAITTSIYADLHGTDNTLTDSEKSEGWKLLFDGKSTTGWHTYKKESLSGWESKDGILTCITPGFGDVESNDQFDNFELELDWKLPAQGNSGVIYRCDNTYDTCWKTGVECQLIDNNWKGGLHPGQKAGAAYEICPPFKDAANPIGEWNHCRIVANGPHCEHWFNGVKVAEYEQGSEDFLAKVAKSKFHEYPKFGTLWKGFICLQDHGANVQFKNIKIRQLPAQ